jgi:hypothetical protein
MDTEIIYNIVTEHIPALKLAVKQHLQKKAGRPKKITTPKNKKPGRKL